LRLDPLERGRAKPALAAYCDGVFERFHPLARQAVACAQIEARELKHRYVGTEHLLLGLLRAEEEAGLDARAAAPRDPTLREVRAVVERVVGRGEDEPEGLIYFSPSAEKVFDLALCEASSSGHDHVALEHLVLALRAERECLAARILSAFEIEAAARPRRTLIETPPIQVMRKPTPPPKAEVAIPFATPWGLSIRQLMVGWSLVGAGIGVSVGWLIWG
jgi:hypothetical protein